MKPFKNEVHFDPGRFNYKISLLDQVTEPDGAGGTEVFLTDVITTWAVQEDIRTVDELAVAEGVSSMNGGCYFIIRSRKSFQPKKDMLIRYDGQLYTIRGIKPMGRPITHYRMLCAYNDLVRYK